MNKYKAVYENGSYEIILSSDDDKAFKEAVEYESMRGPIVNLYMIDDKGEIVRQVF